MKESEKLIIETLNKIISVLSVSVPITGHKTLDTRITKNLTDAQYNVNKLQDILEEEV